MKLYAYQSAEAKHEHRIVRCDDYSDVEGEIVHADEDTGEFTLTVNQENKSFNLGPGGIRILPRKVHRCW